MVIDLDLEAEQCTASVWVHSGLTRFVFCSFSMCAGASWHDVSWRPASTLIRVRVFGHGIWKYSSRSVQSETLVEANCYVLSWCLLISKFRLDF